MDNQKNRGFFSWVRGLFSFRRKSSANEEEQTLETPQQASEESSASEPAENAEVDETAENGDESEEPAENAEVQPETEAAESSDQWKRRRRAHKPDTEIN